jgi:ribosomal protein S18 acetylase RimI-like enzyme
LARGIASPRSRIELGRGSFGRLYISSLRMTSSAAVTVRILSSDEWASFRELRLEALREAPYAFGSAIDDWLGEGDTEQRWRRRLSDVAFNALAYVDDVAAGMVSATASDAKGETELISMWVAPFARGRGVADALVEAVIGWAQEHRVGKVSLEVIEENERARAFYQRHGFVDEGRIESKERARPERRMVRMAR